MEKLGLYIHIPFCESKCGYCDFYSVKATERLQEAYVNALLMQMKEYILPTKENIIDTVFVGGGTPTCLHKNMLIQVVKKIAKCFNVSKDAEFTIEANPYSASGKDFRKLISAGVNRLSIGLQSVHDSELKSLSRIHTFKKFISCYSCAKEAGFENINIDIMYGIPGQTLKSLYVTIKKVIELAPTHISVYGLKIEENTKFYRNIEKIRPVLPGENTEREMYFMCCELLENSGYYQYEISNFAKKDYECKHNLKYWNCSEYVGLGVSAHSYFCNHRFSFKKNIKEYIKNFSYNREKLDDIELYDVKQYSLFDENIEIKPNERIGEFVMLGFRLKEGINKKLFAKLFYKDFDYLYYPKLRPFIESGHIVKTDNGYALTREGMFVSNYILSRIVDFE